MMHVTWKDIPGYEGRYQASTDGQIRSIDRVISQTGRWGMTVNRKIKGKILKPGRYCKTGHVSVVLEHGGHGKPVHQLIALTFLGCPKACEEVRHKDGNPKNNRVENLEYGTRTQNILDVFYQGKVWRKLSLEDVISIKKSLAAGCSCTDLARQYGVSVTSISKINRGRTFSWIDQHACAQ